MKMQRHFDFVSWLPLSFLARLSSRPCGAKPSETGHTRAAAGRPTVFEVLESRTLLSASHALVALRADAKEIKADFAALSKADVANLKLITADLKAAGLLKVDGAALQTLVRGDDVALKLLGNELKHVESVIAREASTLDSDGSRVIKPRHAIKKSKPHNKVKAAIAALSKHAAQGLTTLTKDANSLASTNAANWSALTSAASGDAKLIADVAVAQADLSAALQTLDAIVTQSLTTDVNNLIGLYGEVPIIA